MSIQINSKSQFIWTVLVMSSVVVMASFGLWSCKGPEVDKAVIEAYELRMNGKADEAKAMLEQIVSDEPDNALAHYELARTKYQIMLSALKELETALEDMQQSIDKAIENDPDNVIYPFFAARVAFFPAYMAVQRNQPEAKEKVANLCSIYESVLKLKPDYHEAMLHLVEIYGLLPENMGGDKAKAEEYTQKLEEMDEIFGAKARAILLPDEVDTVDYWQKVLEKHDGNAEVLKDLGRAYLFNDRAEEGTKCLEEAVQIDPEQNVLILDLARYYVMTMRDETKRETAGPMAEKMFRRYLDSEPILPLKAFALGMLANLKRMMGDQEEAKALMEEADKIDPFFSKAFGVPTPDLFIPPGEIYRGHRYLFFPF
ncbi:MAG: TRAP transporter TatT component family protein [Candidatus Aminicenantes bacterium]|nr:TRAP transporter TatT component family protein [Candidatus Aminicenantes bacterium]MDH5383953.1 TRAP transporter TatT component family protein [Candidatus Aminicenantes bacterium]MDH5743684.1 TRAP transporter TatT component family protein [Candidatus Aminicenantes bacterium]